MDFKDIKIGDSVYILENCGTFRKTTSYNIGRVINIGTPYDDSNLSNPYLSQTLKKKLIDVTISCEGIQKKLSVGADKNIITDSTIGLTISTSKTDLINLVDAQLKECEAKIASIQMYREEIDKCKRILNQLKDTPQRTIQEQPKENEQIRIS